MSNSSSQPELSDSTSPLPVTAPGERSMTASATAAGRRKSSRPIQLGHRMSDCRLGFKHMLSSSMSAINLDHENGLWCCTCFSPHKLPCRELRQKLRLQGSSVRCRNVQCLAARIQRAGRLRTRLAICPLVSDCQQFAPLCSTLVWHVQWPFGDYSIRIT